MPVWNAPANPRFTGRSMTSKPFSRQMDSVESVEPSLTTT